MANTACSFFFGQQVGRHSYYTAISDEVIFTLALAQDMLELRHQEVEANALREYIKENLPRIQAHTIFAPAPYYKLVDKKHFLDVQDKGTKITFMSTIAICGLGQLACTAVINESNKGEGAAENVFRWFDVGAGIFANLYYMLKISNHYVNRRMEYVKELKIVKMLFEEVTAILDNNAAGRLDEMIQNYSSSSEGVRKEVGLKIFCHNKENFRREYENLNNDQQRIIDEIFREKAILLDSEFITQLFRNQGSAGAGVQDTTSPLRATADAADMTKIGSASALAQSDNEAVANEAARRAEEGLARTQKKKEYAVKIMNLLKKLEEQAEDLHSQSGAERDMEEIIGDMKAKGMTAQDLKDFFNKQESYYEDFISYYEG
jgi:hypothetical protein